MSKAKHTPGPWVVDLDRRFTLGGDLVAIEATTPDGTKVVREVCTSWLDTDEWPDGPQWAEDAANARLIAAAPAFALVWSMLSPRQQAALSNALMLAGHHWAAEAIARSESDRPMP